MFMRSSIEDKKEYLADIAAKFFFEKGYKTATLQDIANEAGITKAAIYYYFKAKEQILYHIIVTKSHRFLSELEECLKKCEEKKLGAEETSKQLLLQYGTDLNKDNEATSLILRERHQLTGKYKKEIYEIEKKFFEIIKKQFENIPSINNKYDHNVISFMVISFSHWMKYWLKERGKLTIDNAMQQFIDIIFAGILKK